MKTLQRNAGATGVMGPLASYIAGAVDRPLPDTVAEKARHHLLDTIAAMVSGTTLTPGRLGIESARAAVGAGEAIVVGTDIVTSAETAAFANGMTSRADETDDSHASSFTHPGCGIIAAAMAMAERERRSGAELLRAIALGYDVNARLTRALGVEELCDRGFSTHAFGPLWGATAASAALASLDEAQVRAALSLTAQCTSGMVTWMGDTAEHVELSFLMGGRPAQDGLRSAALAKIGFSANPDVFASLPNFLTIYSRTPDPAELTRDLGGTYEILAANIKKYCVGSPIQAGIDSMLALIGDHDLTADKVRGIDVHLPAREAGIMDGRETPTICAQHIVALVLVDRAFSFAAAHEMDRMRDPEILAARAKVRLVPDKELENLLPRRTATVRIETADGRMLEHHTPAVLGTSDLPMTRDQVADKARELMAPVLGAARSSALIDGIWNIDGVADVRELRPLLAG
ncbi:MAG: MmgE/PrpD family protein [Acetobacterales bacterium]